MRASRGEGGRASALGGSLYFLSSNVSYNGYMFLFGLAFCARARGGRGRAHARAFSQPEFLVSHCT